MAASIFQLLLILPISITWGCTGWVDLGSL